MQYICPPPTLTVTDGTYGVWIFKKTTGQLEGKWKIVTDDGTEYILHGNSDGATNCDYQEYAVSQNKYGHYCPITVCDSAYIVDGDPDECVILHDYISERSSVNDWEEGGKIYNYFKSRKMKVYPQNYPEAYAEWENFGIFSITNVSDAGTVYGDINLRYRNQPDPNLNPHPTSIGSGYTIEDIVKIFDTSFNNDEPIVIEAIKK